MRFITLMNACFLQIYKVYTEVLIPSCIYKG